MRSIDTERLDAIQQMLLALTNGDFNYRIPRTREDDQIEAIAALLNMVAEEMFVTLSFYNSLHVVDGKKQHLHTVFILKPDFKIQYVTADVEQLLGYARNELINSSFSSILSKSHIPQWRELGREMVYAKEYNKQHPFLLVQKDGLERNYLCGFTSIFDVSSSSQYIIVSIYEQVIQSKILEDEIKSNIYISHEESVLEPGTPYVVRNKNDIQILHDIKHHILKNLDTPLPNLKELAHEFGINEFKLKYGFRQLFGNSVFRFLKQERLDKGRVLLESTPLSLKEIAGMCGYLSATHFIRDFRIQYGITPKVFRDQKGK